MRIYTIINQKGGVGKSTTAAALAAYLTEKRYRVLCVDLDAQGNLSYSMGASGNGAPQFGAFEVLTRKCTAAQAATVTKWGLASGDLIASSAALVGADATITETGKEYRLKEALIPLGDKYDYCIIDTPPALGVLTINALTAAHAAIIPAQADVFSLNGVAQLHQTIQTVQQYTNCALCVEGILLTRYNGRAVISRDIAEVLKETAEQMNTRLFDSKIRECTALKEAQASKSSIFRYAPKSNAAEDYAAFCEELLKGEAEK